MPNCEQLIIDIQETIRENGNNEITGPILQDVLVDMVYALCGEQQSFDELTMWSLLSKATPEQINVSHLSATDVAGMLTQAGYKLTDTTYALATDAVAGLLKTGYAASGRDYAVKLDEDGRAYVNVPWTDKFDTYFGIDEDGNIYVKDNRGFWSSSFISARGSDPEAGSGGGGSGVDMESVWYALAQPTSEKINVSHLSANNVAQLLTAAGYKLTDTTYGLATDTVSGLVKTGYAENGKNYAVKLDGTGAAYVTVNWQDKFDTYFGVDGDGNVYVKDNRGFYGNSFVSARGSDPEAGSGGSGGGLDVQAMWYALGQPTTEKINASHIPAIGMDKVSGLQSALSTKLESITKPMVEEVLTGTITSHNHDGRYAPLSGGLIPSQYLPSYVDDVLEYASTTAFPATGEAGKIYVALDTNLTYRWGGSAYVEISPSLALGYTSSTAYPGDEGAALAALVEGMKEITDLFGIDEGGNVYVKDGRGFYGTSFVSARGSDPEAGSGGGGGVGIDMTSVWYALGQPTNEKINVSHIPALQQLSGTLTNAQLANSDITVAGVRVSLGGAVTTAQIGSALTGSGYKLTDTTYTLTKSGSTITLTGSNGSKTSVTDSNTTYTLGSFGITATASELNKLDGLATTATELGYVHGVTSNIQTQLNGKANTSALSAYLPLTGGTMTGEILMTNSKAFVARMTTDTANYRTALGWRSVASGALIAQIGFWNTDHSITLNPCSDEVSEVWVDEVGKYNFVVGKNRLTYNTYPLLHSGNYTTLIDSRYVKKSGDTMTGTLTISTSACPLYIQGGSSAESYLRVRLGGTDKSAFGYSSSLGTYLYSDTYGGYLSLTDSGLARIYKGSSLVGTLWHSGNDGSGSGLDADLLDGTQKSGLLTSVASTAATNLSVTVGGTVKSVADLYATYLDGHPATSFDLSTNLGACQDYGVYVIGLMQITDYTAAGNMANGTLIFIRQNGNNPAQKIIYSLSTRYGSNNVRFGYLTLSTNIWVQPCTFTYNGKKWAGFQVSSASSYSSGVICVRDGLRLGERSSPFLLKYGELNTGAVINSEVNSSVVINGADIIESGVHSNAFSGNASSATKLATARSLWGQSFDGTGGVNGDIYLNSQSHRIFFGTSGTTAYLSAGDGYFTINKATNTSYAANLLRINFSSGAVGINAVPSATLHVGGTGYFSSNLEVAGTIHSSVGIWSNGYVSAKGQDTTSDARYKRDVAALPAQAALAVLMRLRPSTWAWKDDGRRGAGFVAQEVMGVLPEAVREVGGGEDRHLALNYQMLHAYEVCLLQTHEERLTKLENEIRKHGTQ